MNRTPVVARRRRSRARSLSVRCPSCGAEARAEAVHTPGGWVHAGRMQVRTLMAHADCDLLALSDAFGRAALERCRLRGIAVFEAPRGAV